MKRLQFITSFGAMAATCALSWSRTGLAQLATGSPLAARARQPAMPDTAISIAAKPDNPANALDPLLQQAQALGAPMAAVA
ncbi:MAG TPA: hypothetical protein VFN27_11895, partial [Xanthobacteraceae bacterium]|nr:hypothetical protein [Xanthobacteraceae bacterium]